MRVVKAFFTSILILGLGLGAIFLIAREILLLTAAIQVRQSLIWVKELDNNQQYLAQCSSLGVSRSSIDKVHSTQLRYTQPNRYVIEVICGGMENNPIKVAGEKLPPLVTHETRQSGLRWGSNSALNFKLYNRTYSVSVVAGTVSIALKPAQTETITGPASDCVSYGYECCDLNVQQGAGRQIREALDCPQTCYQTCAPRPLVLNFRTEPHYDQLTRGLSISQGQTVAFSFAVSPNQDPVLSRHYDEEDWLERTISMVETVLTFADPDEEVTVILDYGDGEQDEFKSYSGQAEHTYKCPQASCEYIANLQAVNEKGIVSADGLQNKIKIKVN